MGWFTPKTPSGPAIVVLGNGAAGVAAAIRIRALQPSWRITLVSSESDTHYSRPALMYIFMGHMRFADTVPYPEKFFRDHAIDRVRGWVSRIDAAAARLEFEDGRTLPYDKLLIATGSVSKKFGWPGEDLPNVQGLYSIQDLERLERNVRDCRRAVIVGGGLIGVELAEMLHSRGIHVVFLVRESSYWNHVLPTEESEMVNRELRGAGVELRLGTTLREIQPGAVVTSAGERIDCGFVGLTIGVSPNVAVARASGIPCERGVLVDRALRTRVEGIYAAGDCAEIETIGIEQLWYTAKRQGDVAGAVIAGAEQRYERGVFYNSAKFFDLEYQTYGRLDGESVFWQSADRRRAIRIAHSGGVVTGFNGMGVRFRHRVCEAWIQERRDLEYVLAHLRAANFDPEFSRSEARILQAR